MGERRTFSHLFRRKSRVGRKNSKKREVLLNVFSIVPNNSLNQTNMKETYVKPGGTVVKLVEISNQCHKRVEKLYNEHLGTIFLPKKGIERNYLLQKMVGKNPTCPNIFRQA